MDFTIEFIKHFALGLYLAAPILLFLVGLVLALGLIIGKKQGWPVSDSVYFAFITATTVGYGDYRPENRSGKFLAIAIAFIGLLLTGIVVAIGVQAATIAFEYIHSQPVAPR